MANDAPLGFSENKIITPEFYGLVIICPFKTDITWGIPHFPTHPNIINCWWYIPLYPTCPWQPLRISSGSWLAHPELLRVRALLRWCRRDSGRSRDIRQRSSERARLGYFTDIFATLDFFNDFLFIAKERGLWMCTMILRQNISFWWTLGLQRASHHQRVTKCVMEPPSPAAAGPAGPLRTR